MSGTVETSSIPVILRLAAPRADMGISMQICLHRSDASAQWAQ